MVKSINEKFSKGWAPADLEREASLRGSEQSGGKPPQENDRAKKIKQRAVVDSYAECYPGWVRDEQTLWSNKSI